jgi:long-chain acyl-CoA synthetase
MNKIAMIAGNKKLTCLDILRDYILPKIEGEDFVFKTSGTTGKPKTYYHNIKKFLKRYEVDRPGYTTLITLDLDRIGGFDALLHTFFYSGLAIVPNPITPDNVLELIDKYKVELLITTPTLLRLILLRGIYDHNLSSLKIISFGSERMPEYVLDKLKELLPDVKLKQTYGATELGVFRTHSEGNLIKILDRETKIEDGLLYVLDENGWICTGDRAEYAEDNFIKILGRGSNVINTGGYKVQAEEVEDVLLRLVEDCLVYGESNDLLGEMVVADIVCKSTTDECILNFCKEQLKKYQIPMKFYHVDKIEYTENGKRKRK